MAATEADRVDSDEPAAGWRALRERLKRPAIWGGALILIAFVARIVYGRAILGYDASYALYWGDRLASGRAPGFDIPVAPTPHPLTILEGAFAVQFGVHAPQILEWISFFSFAAFVLTAFAFGRRVFGTPVGVVFALLIAIVPNVVSIVLQSMLDIQFLFLMLLAGYFAYPGQGGERPRRATACLTLAGLLRPEAWIFGGFYLLWIAWRRGLRSGVIGLGALLALAPLVWFVLDFLVTGDPLHSLHGTQDLAATLHRNRGGMTAVRAAPAYVREMLSVTILFCAAAGVIAGVFSWPKPTMWLTSVMALSVGMFVGLGLLGLPLIDRYLALPAVIALLFVALLLAGWADLPQGERDRPYLFAAALVGALAILVAVPDRIDAVDSARLGVKGVAVNGSRASYLANSMKRAGWCAPIGITGGYNAVPHVAYRLKLDPDDVVTLRTLLQFDAGTALVFIPSLAIFKKLEESGFTRITPKRMFVSAWTKCGD